MHKTMFWTASLLALSGCFSSADFADCPTGNECGAYHTCQAGRCVPNFELELDAAVEGDDQGATSPDAARDQGPDGLEIMDLRQQPLNENIDAPGMKVILGENAVQTKELIIRAAVIEIEGPIEADAVGGSAGGGGGGGSGGHLTLRPMGGTGGENASSGTGASSERAGDGGQGGLGVGVFGGLGGRPGDADQPNGGAGQDGRFHSSADHCDTPGLFQVGSGGGGGGGGRGSNGLACRSGGGGGGGGAGGPGGGALGLEATTRIVIRAKLSATGEAAPTREPETVHNGGPTCGGGDDCQQTCGQRSAVGGAGSNDTGPGRRGDPDAGNGGIGGAGSGGTIRIEAPRIVLEEGARFDVRGGNNNPGVILFVGDTEGISVISEGGAPFCTQ